MSIGGKTVEQALAGLSDMTGGMQAITPDEHWQRIAKTQRPMQ